MFREEFIPELVKVLLDAGEDGRRLLKGKEMFSSVRDKFLFLAVFFLQWNISNWNI